MRGAAVLATSRQAMKLAERHARWKPGVVPFLLPFAILLAVNLWAYAPSSSPQSWVLTFHQPW